MFLENIIRYPFFASHSGYLQEVNGTEFALPSGIGPSLTLLVSPHWQEGQEGPVSVNASWDAEIGSFHAEIAVPGNAKIGQYSLSVQLPDGAPESGPGPVPAAVGMAGVAGVAQAEPLVAVSEPGIAGMSAGMAAGCVVLRDLCSRHCYFICLSACNIAPCAFCLFCSLWCKPERRSQMDR